MKPAMTGSRRFAILMVIAICVHVTFCLSLRYHFLNPLFYISTHAKGQGGCFFGIYQAGVNLLNGESIYGCETYRTPKELAVPFYHFYRYLPFTSYVSSIFAKVLGPWPAYWVWIVINEILLAACIVITVRLRKRFGSAALIAASFWLLFSPIYTELYMGQFCFMMTFFILLILYPYLRGPSPLGSRNPGCGGTSGGGNPGYRGGTSGGGNPGRGNTESVFPAIPESIPESHEEATRAATNGSYAVHNPTPTGPGTVQGPGAHGSAAHISTKNPGASADLGFGRASASGPLPPLCQDTQHAPGRPHGWVAPLCWVLSVLLKSFTALYTLTLFRIGKKKLALAGIAAAVLTSAPYFARHPQDLRWFFQLNFQPLPSYSVGGCLGFCSLLRDMSDRLLSSVSIQEINLTFFDVSARNIPLVIVLAAIFITTFLLTVRKRTIDPLGNITLWTLTFFLIFKDIWEYHYVMLLPLFVGFYLQTRSKYLLVLFILLAVPTPIFFYDVPTSDHPQAHWSAPLSIMHHSFKAVPTFLFYLWVLRRELREGGGVRRLLAFGRAH